MRVRESRLWISSFLGHFFIRGTDLLALPNVDEDKAFAVEIAHEENAQNVSNCCLQAALLYTTSDGERRIRVHTMQVPASAAVATLFESADVDAAPTCPPAAADQAVKSALLDGAEKMQTSCMERSAPSARSARRRRRRRTRCCSPSCSSCSRCSAGPDEDRGLQHGGGGARRRSDGAHLRARDDGVRALVALMHPRLFQLFPPPATPSPLPLPLTALSTPPPRTSSTTGCRHAWLGHAVPTEFLQGAFGWGTLDGVDASALRLLPADSSPTARQIDELVSLLRSERPHSWLRVRVMKQGEGDAPFLRCLVEDQTKQMMSYGDFVMHCHRYVLSKA